MGKPKGLLISIEGVTGAGKTTLVKRLSAVGGPRRILIGGYSKPRREITPFHRNLLQALRRQITVDPFLRLGWRAELLVVLAELQLANESLVQPHLRSGAVILYEHHLDSIVAYEAARTFEDGIQPSIAAAVRRILGITHSCAEVELPRGTLYISIDPAEAARRAALRDGRRNTPREIRFNEYVARAYDRVLARRSQPFLCRISAAELASPDGTARVLRWLEALRENL